MANKRISELQVRTPQVTDLMLIGDPTTGYSYKCTIAQTIGLANAVPYSGATQNVNLGEWGISLGHVSFDTTPTGIPTSQGTVYWDDSRSTLALIMNGTTQHIGQDQFYYVKNSTGSTIPKGTAVRFAGTNGASGHILIAPMIANGSFPSQYYMGVTSEEIVNGGFGQVMAFGELSGVNTSGYTAGDILYVSTTVAGAFQTTAPVAPNNIIIAAAAINSTNNGTIQVRATLGSNIKNDEGVLLSSAQTGHTLIYNASNGLFENATPISLSTIGSSGAATYNFSTRTLNIPNYGAALSGYLPLTGGTLTGALNGTSATFSNLYTTGNSGIATSSPKTITNGFSLTIGDGATQQQPYLALARTATGGYWAGIRWYDNNTIKSFVQENSDFDLLIGTSNTTRLTIASTGASTFSSTITSNGGKITAQNSPSNIGVYISANEGAYGSLQATDFSNSAVRNLVLQPYGGNIGIGVTPSAANLPTLEMQYGLFNGTSEVNIMQNVVYNSGFKYLASNSATRYYQGGGSHQWFIAASGTAGSAISFTQAMTLDASGRLGIGTTSIGAGYQFQVKRATNVNIGFGLQNSGISLEAVNDAINANIPMSYYASAHYFLNGNVGIGTSSPGATLDIQNQSSNNLRISYDANYYWRIARNASSGALTFEDASGSSPSERMRITSGGAVCINATTTIANSSERLTVTSDGDTSFFRTTTSSGGGTAMHVNRSASNGNLLYFSYGTGFSTIGSISTNGSSTSYNTSSDYRLKTDLKDFAGVDIVNLLKVYDYQWKSDNSRSYGVLAHELQSVIPYAVTGVKDGEQMQGVDYSKLVPVLIKAIQELKSQIDSK